MRLNIFSLFAVLFLSACVTLGGGASAPTLSQLIQSADVMAQNAGLTKRIIQTDRFKITTYGTLKAPGQPVRIYIEGDGYIQRAPKVLSDNPTPINPLALKLAIADPYDNVIYMARPCQFTRSDPECHPQYWSSHRYAPEILNAAHQALNYIRNHYNMTDFELVGFSGGGAVAAILAAHRDDILNLRSVAGNLDHIALFTHHGYSLMPYSLNAADFAPGLESMPQMHFIGGHDSLILPLAYDSYVARMSTQACSAREMVAGASHQSGWVERWPSLVAKTPTCAQGS